MGRRLFQATGPATQNARLPPCSLAAAYVTHYTSRSDRCAFLRGRPEAIVTA